MRFFEEVLNGRKLSTLSEFISDTYVEHGAMRNQEAGLKGVRQHIELFFSAFSNTRYRLNDTITEGDKIVARWTLTGKHTGPFMDLAPTGREIETSGIDIYALDNGRITEHWHEIDMFRLVTELDPARRCA